MGVNDYICRHCDATFRRRPAWGRPDPQYCSTACFRAARFAVVARNCGHCGAEFRVGSYRAKEPDRGKFCSPSCYWKAKVGTGRPLAERFWERVEKSDGCWLWTGSKNRKGYGVIGEGGEGRDLIAPRVIWEWTNGPIPPGMMVCHHCDVPACVNPDHLFLGTPADNMLDKVAKGRQRKGETVPGAKLTEAGVREIRRRRTAGEPQKAIAADYGVSQSVVSNIMSRRTWKHII